MINAEMMREIQETYDLIPKTAGSFKGILEGTFVHGVLEAMVGEVPISIRRTDGGRIAVVQGFPGQDAQQIAGYGDTLAEAIKNWLSVSIERSSR